MKVQTGFDWSTQAGTGPATYQVFLGPAMYTPFGEAVIERTPIARGAHVLDVACGTGIVSRLASRRAGKLGTVTGVDMNSGMLDVARTTPSLPLSAPITYVEGDAEHLPVDDADYDVAICHQALQYFGDRVAALHEMHRALAPGGRLAIGTWTKIEDQVPFDAIQWSLARHLGFALGAMMRAPFSLGDPEELTGLLETAGFRDVKVDTVHRKCVFASWERFAERAILAGPLASYFVRATPEERQYVIDDVKRDTRSMRTVDGRMQAGMTSLIATATA